MIMYILIVFLFFSKGPVIYPLRLLPFPFSLFVPLSITMFSIIIIITILWLSQWLFLAFSQPMILVAIYSHVVISFFIKLISQWIINLLKKWIWKYHISKNNYGYVCRKYKTTTHTITIYEHIDKKIRSLSIISII
jgi:hypothetical protein